MTQEKVAKGELSPAKLRLLRATRGPDVTAGTIVARDWHGEAPASSSQQAMWFLDRLLSPLSKATNTAHDLLVSTRVLGPLRVDVLERALTEIVRRHAVLRTTFGESDGRPVQRIQPPYELSLPVTDLSDRDGDRDELITSIAVDEIAIGFDLVTGPLVRGRLLRFADDEHVMLVVIHHIIFDGVSGEIFLRELGQLYDAFAEDRPSPLPPLPIQFFDYAAWEQEYLTGDNLAQLSAYWRQALAGCDGVLDLPTDRPRPPVPSPHGAEARFVLPEELTRRLQEFCHREHVSMYVVILTAFQTLLARYANQQDVLIGACYANRRRPEVENLIGFLVNTLVMRADFRGDPSFREMVRRVGEVAMRAFDHREMPFDMVVKEVRPDRSVGFNPLFQVMYVYQGGAPTRAMEPGLLRFEWLDLEIPDATFDIVFVVDDEPDRISGKFRYTTDLFDAPTMARLTRHFITLLDGVVSEPDLPVSRVRMMPPDERESVVRAWNDTGHDVDPRPVHELIAETVARAGDRFAVICGDARLTYRELDQRANRLANHLRRRGIGPEDLVGVHLARSAELPVAVLGILKAGAAYLPMDVDHPRERLLAMLADAPAAAILTSEDLAEGLRTAGTYVLALDRDWDRVAEEPDTDPAVRVHPDNLAYVLHTSGSTGRPKGAMNTHRGLSSQLAWVQRTYPIGEADRLLHKTPAGFDVSVRELLWPLVAGARLVLAAPGGHRDPAHLVDVIESNEVTVVHFVPAMLAAFLDAPDLARRCRTLRRVICSGEALSGELQQRYFASLDSPLNNFYGPAEATIDVAHWPCRPDRQQAALIGRPVDNTRLYVLDALMQPVPVGVPGELYIGGHQVGRGYAGAPATTAERFLPSPFGEPGARIYRTGDLARWTADGELEIIGRTDFQVKIRGYRIEPGEVEAVLTASPSVRTALVLLRDDGPGDPALVAYVVPEDGAHPAAAELRQVVAERLPEYMVPSAFVTLDALPLNANGKVDRGALPAPDGAARPSSVEYVTPRTAVERALAQVWAEVLQVDRVGLYDDFFELGGHSLTATRVVARLRDRVGLDVPVNRIFLDRSLVKLAEHVAAQMAAATSLQPVGSGA
jgi:amino acid adenylation domain-containing protein